MNVCETCHAPIEPTPGKKQRRYCSPTCRMRAHRALRARPSATTASVTICPSEFEGSNRNSPERAYSAASIRILSAAEVAESQPWVLAQTLAAEYRQPIEFVERLLETCRLSGWPVSAAIARYLEGDRSVPILPDVGAVHAETVRRHARENHRRK